MPVENFRFGGGAEETVLHPLVLVAMLIAILLIFLLPRKYAIAPLLAIVLLTPLGQEVNAWGLHFSVMRIVILAAWVKMLASKFSSEDGIFGKRLDWLDLTFLLWAVCRATAVMLLFMAPGAAINQFGFLLDVLGGFFLLRYLIRDDEDIRRAVATLVVVSVIVAGGMIIEKLRMVNVFGLLGGVRVEPDVRAGSIRAQGPFEHELLAGTFGGTVLPLFFLLWKTGKAKIFAVIGIIAATIIVLTSQSSTPALAYAAAAVGICCFPLRRKMRLVRWGMIAALGVLALVMKAPVWFVIAHIDVVGGSSGYHRAMLVNDFIMHFREWWLIGTKDNPSWGFDMWDLCNQYVAEGETGGLVTFLLFLGMITICFSRIGKALKAVSGDRMKEWYYWIFGATLFSHVVAFFGISYFDQTRFAWFALLAMISAATAPYLAVARVTEKQVTVSGGGLRPAYLAGAAAAMAPVPRAGAMAAPAVTRVAGTVPAAAATTVAVKKKAQNPKYKLRLRSRFSWARVSQPK